MERQNNEHLDSLSEQVAMLKNLTMDIDAEVKDQNTFLENMGISFAGAGEVSCAWFVSSNRLLADALGDHASPRRNVEKGRTQASHHHHRRDYRPIFVCLENYESCFTRKHVTTCAGENNTHTSFASTII